MNGGDMPAGWGGRLSVRLWLVAALSVAFAVAVLAASGVWAAGAGGPPAGAVAPVKLHRVPVWVENQCRLMRGRVGFAFPCPRRLPLATLPPRSGLALPRLHAQRAVYRDMGGTVYKLDFSYGAPFERRHWRNRPCCFLHFEVLRRPATAISVPSGARPAVLGGRRGLFKPAYGYGIACGAGDRGLFWCNHVAFLWRERGQNWVATLHYFAPGESRALLGRLVSELRFG